MIFEISFYSHPDSIAPMHYANVQYVKEYKVEDIYSESTLTYVSIDKSRLFH